MIIVFLGWLEHYSMMMVLPSQRSSLTLFSCPRAPSFPLFLYTMIDRSGDGSDYLVTCNLCTRCYHEPCQIGKPWSESDPPSVLTLDCLGCRARGGTQCVNLNDGSTALSAAILARRPLARILKSIRRSTIESNDGWGLATQPRGGR